MAASNSLFSQLPIEVKKSIICMWLILCVSYDNLQVPEFTDEEWPLIQEVFDEHADKR